jgi:hypothetical protein
MPVGVYKKLETLNPEIMPVNVKCTDIYDIMKIFFSG